MTLKEKDQYIEEHLMPLTAETLRFMVADHVAEIKHWKANHNDLKNRLAVVQTRPDLPLDRLAIYDRMSSQIRIMREALEQIERGVMCYTNFEIRTMVKEALAKSV